MTRAVGFITMAVLTLLIASRSAAGGDEAGTPPVFSKLGLDEAKKQAMEEGKVLVVKATAVWCGPCKAMDKTTWRNDEVVKWFGEHGIAIQLDVDKQPRQAKELRISAMPTMLAFRDGKEFDRIVGYQSAEQLLRWLRRVSAGKREADAVMDRLKDVRDGKADLGMQERLQFARELVEHNKPAEATEEYTWLWLHMVEKEPAMYGVRGSFLASDMHRLVESHPPAKAAFAGLRDEAQKTLDDKGPRNKAGIDALSDWVVLNSILGDNEKTLAWYDRVSADPAWHDAIDRVSFRLNPLLEAKGKWKERGNTLPNPDSRLEWASRMLDMSADRELPDELKDMKETLVRQAWTSFRDTVSKDYVSYLASGRSRDAETLANGALRKDDSAELRLSLVRWAIKAKQVHEKQRAWLDEAGAKGDDRADVREAFENALKDQVK